MRIRSDQMLECIILTINFGQCIKLSSCAGTLNTFVLRPLQSPLNIVVYVEAYYPGWLTDAHTRTLFNASFFDDPWGRSIMHYSSSSSFIHRLSRVKWPFNVAIIRPINISLCFQFPRVCEGWVVFAVGRNKFIFMQSLNVLFRPMVQGDVGKEAKMS